jgi:hypothetical protein
VTDKGLDALRAWAITPVHFPSLEHEPLVRILITDLVGEAVVRESIGTLRADIADLAARLDAAERWPRRCPIAASTSCSATSSAVACSTCTWSGSTTSSESWKPTGLES